MKLLLLTIASVLVLAAILATVGGVPVSSVVAFSVLTALLFGAVFVFDLAA
jgi:hypothetical protein